MSILITEIPPCNSIRLTPYKDSTTPENPRYNFTHFDADLFQDTIQSWQLQKWYFQKRQLNDRVTIQVHTQNNSGALLYTGIAAYPPNLSLYDYISGAKVFDLNTGAGGAYRIGSQIVTGNVYGVSNIQLDTHLWTARMSQLTASTEGIYQFILTTYDYTGATGEIWRSEPIHVKSVHADTILLEYNPRPIQDHIVLANWPNNYVPYFGQRVEGDIRNFAPTGNAVDYKDASYNQYQLDGVAWRNFKLKIGGQNRVPSYMIDKVNNILLTGPFSIDGKQFIYVNENSSSNGVVSLWNINDPTTSMFIDGSVIVRENTIVDSYTKVSAKILLFTSPGGGTVTYPYAIPYLKMTDIPRGITISTATKVINNSGDETALLSYLNGAFYDLYDLTGSFTHDAVTGNWYYTLGAGEYFYIIDCPLLTTYLSINLAITVINSPFQFNYSGGLNVFDWGDAFIEYVDAVPSVSITKAHTYAAISTPVLRIFTDNNMDGLNFNYHTTAAHITDIVGTTNVSSKLTFFTIDSTDLSALTSLDPSFLNNAQTTIQTVAFTNTRIKAFSPDVFATSTNPALVTAYFGNNQLSSTNVDDIINQIKTSIWGIGSTSGTIDVRQTPTAPPTGASATNMALLISAGWTIYHD